MSYQSIRSKIFQTYQRNPKARVKDVASAFMCSTDYVYVCLSQFGIKVQSDERDSRDRNRHNLTQPYAGRQPSNQHCRKLTYVDGHTVECGAPTKGHTYCKHCRDALVTMFDPIRPTTTQAAA